MTREHIGKVERQCQTCKHYEQEDSICVLHTPEPDPEAGHGNWVEVEPQDVCEEWQCNG